MNRIVVDCASVGCTKTPRWALAPSGKAPTWRSCDVHLAKNSRRLLRMGNGSIALLIEEI